MNCLGRDPIDDRRLRFASPTQQPLTDDFPNLEARLLAKLMPAVKAHAHEEAVTVTSPIILQIHSLESRVVEVARQLLPFNSYASERLHAEAKQSEELAALRKDTHAFTTALRDVHRLCESYGAKDARVESPQVALSREEHAESLKSLRLDIEQKMERLQCRLDEALQMQLPSKIQESQVGNGALVPAMQGDLQMPLPDNIQETQVPNSTPVSRMQADVCCKESTVVADNVPKDWQLTNQSISSLADVKSEIQIDVLAILRDEIKQSILSAHLSTLPGDHFVDEQPAAIADSFETDGVLGKVIEYEFQESVWDAALLIGMSHIPCITNVMIALIVLVNIFAQAVFCIVIGSTFTDANLPGVDSMKYWRTAAHAYQNRDPVTGFSLVSRVCAQDASLQVAESQINTVANSEMYLGEIPLLHLPTGKTLFALAWLLWAMIATADTIENFNFCVALLHVPRGSRTQWKRTAEGFEISQIGFARVVVMTLLTLLRLGVSNSLLVFGTLWLVNTVNVENIILNASALGFILDVDNMLFAVFMPPVVKLILGSLQPLCLPTPDKVSILKRMLLVNIGLQPMLAFVLIGSLFVWSSIQVESISSHLYSLNQTLCNGVVDFVWEDATMSSLLVIASASPPFMGKLSDLAPAQLNKVYAAEQIWNGTVTAENSLKIQGLAFLAPNFGTFSIVAFSTSEMMTESPEYVRNLCIDENIATTAPFLLKIIQLAANVPGATTCPEVKAACGFRNASVLRIWCASTCGCSDPTSGLYLSGSAAGCPRTKCAAQPGYLTIMQTLKCVDPPEEELINTPGWITFWEQWEEDQLQMGSTIKLGDDCFVPCIANRSRTLGCDVILLDATFPPAFCYESSSTGAGSLAAFCPVVCGCRRFPNLAGCPPSCESYDAAYQAAYERALADIPCQDVTNGTFANADWSNPTPVMTFTMASVHWWEDYKPKNWASFQEIIPALDTYGCAHLLLMNPEVCNPSRAPNLIMFCPQMCRCGPENSTTICPRSCRK